MPLESVLLCPRCRHSRCDGGVWQIVKVINSKTEQDETSQIPPSNLLQCTFSMFGVKRDYRQLALGVEVTREFKNWTTPSYVTVRKVEM